MAKIKVKHDETGAVAEALDAELGAWRRSGWTPVDDETDTAKSGRADKAVARSGSVAPDNPDEE